MTNMTKTTEDQAADYALRLIVAARKQGEGAGRAFLGLLQQVPPELGLWAVLTQCYATFDTLGREHYADQWGDETREAVMDEALRDAGVRFEPTTSVVAMMLRACGAINVLGERVYGQQWAALTADEAALADLDAELDKLTE